MESNGTVLAEDAVPSLQVSVMSTVVAMPDDPREPLVYRGGYATYPRPPRGMGPVRETVLAVKLDR